jgi:YggT family protein
MAIPGNSVAEQVVIGGFGNFIAIYNSVITARILLSWFPAAQGVGFLQPVFQITDPYLNLFRGIIPPIFGLDLSPILAFVTLNLLQSSAVSLAAEVSEEMKLRMEKSGGSSWWDVAVKRGRRQLSF